MVTYHRLTSGTEDRLSSVWLFSWRRTLGVICTKYMHKLLFCLSAKYINILRKHIEKKLSYNLQTCTFSENIAFKTRNQNETLIILAAAVRHADASRLVICGN